MRNIRGQVIAEVGGADSETKDLEAPEVARGGSPGVITNRSVVGGISRADDHEVRKAVKSKKYRVINGGYIMTGNVRSPLRPGKIVTEDHYDVPKLLLHGIILEEIKEAAPVEVVPATIVVDVPTPQGETVDDSTNVVVTTEEAEDTRKRRR